MTKASRTSDETAPSTLDDKPICGVIRPIAELDDYPAAHWIDVHAIIADAVDQSGFRARLVSESDASGVILSEIVSNLYSDPIVVCDVSERNPNVMFELGMRLAFEMPTIIIKDDATPFSFDISPVKHLVYPRSLRFQEIVDFKSKLSKAINATIDASQNSENGGYLQQFGSISVTQLGEQSLDLNSLAEELRDTRRMIQSIRPTLSQLELSPTHPLQQIANLVITIEYDESRLTASALKKRLSEIMNNFSLITDFYLSFAGDGVCTVRVNHMGSRSVVLTVMSYLNQNILSIDGVTRMLHS